MDRKSKQIFDPRYVVLCMRVFAKNGEQDHIFLCGHSKNMEIPDYMKKDLNFLAKHLKNTKLLKQSI